MYEKKYINNNSFSKMKRKYNNSKSWRNFSEECIKNSFLKEYLKNKYNNKCVWCEKNIVDNNFVIHHLDYDNICKYNESLPNCEKCYKEDFKQFKLCEEKLVIVHPYCNVMIAKVFRKLKK